MSVIGGYQSDVNLQTIDFVGDFPLENSLGGFGKTTGTTDHYLLALNPPISEYRKGMHLIVNFNHPNTGVSSLNINGLGLKLLKKAVDGQLVNLAFADLNNRQFYHVIYDGGNFQVASGLEPSIPTATTTQKGIAEIAAGDEVLQGTDNERIVTPLTLQAKQDRYLNREVLLTIAGDQISSDISAPLDRNKYVAVNDNLIIGKEIRLRSSLPTPATFTDKHLLNLPKPLADLIQATVLTTAKGSVFLIEIDQEGRTYFTGTFTSRTEELILNFTPYLAKFPLEYHENNPG